MELSGKRVLVVGLGKSGVSAARFLAASGARVSVTDEKKESELSESLSQLKHLAIEKHFGGHPIEPFLESDLIVLSPGVPLALETLGKAREAGIPVFAEVELASRFLKDRLVGITGSNGKSTTTALAAHLLASAGIEASACGNIGRPLIEYVETTSEGRVLVVELSSFQLETIESFHPFIATVLNITPDHMDRYRDFDGYKSAKLRLFKNLQPKDHVVVNLDEEHAEEIKTATNARPTFFSRDKQLHDGVCLDSGMIVLTRGGKPEPVMTASELPIRGPHNLSNALAAIAVAVRCGAGIDKISAGLKSFKPLEHRLEPVGRINGVLFVNDSKATNVDSAAVALQSFDTPLLAIMGGRDKEGNFQALRPIVTRYVKRLILIGEAAPKIAGALDGTAPIERCKSMEEAVKAGLEAAESGDVVLLAPACTSFDMYGNFEERGIHFKQIIRGLGNAGR